MYSRLNVCRLILLLTCSIYLTNCAPSKGEKTASSNSSLQICNESECIKTICPNYVAIDANSTTDKSACKVIGSCEIPNMELTSQLTIPVHGDVACAPTSLQMELDSLIANESPSLSGWLESYSKIAHGPSSLGAACQATDTDCKQVVTIGDKLINASWAQEGRPVTASEVSTMLLTIKNEKTPVAETFSTNTYPSNLSECDYVAGEHAITNSTLWFNVVLYLNYGQIVGKTSSYNGVPMIEIEFKPFESGHFIAMNGYNTTSTNIIYKFHCPIYGIKWYAMRSVKINQPFCAASKGGVCSNYIKVTQLPSGFEGGEAGSFTFLEEYPGEELDSKYTYKIIASISGIK